MTNTTDHAERLLRRSLIILALLVPVAAWFTALLTPAVAAFGTQVIRFDGWLNWKVFGAKIPNSPA